MRLSILFGGPAGAGPNILTNILGNALVNLGYFVFYSRDYQSLIRGGHNFNVLTFSDCSCSSNDSSIDILVALDSNTISVHKKQLVKKGIILGNSEHPNMYYAGKLFKTLGLDFTLLEKELKKLEKRLNENMIEAKLGYEEGIIQFNLNLKNKNKFYFANGNSALSEGAIKSGLKIYYAYPMTPATPVMMELALRQTETGIKVIELENEIAVANAGVGSTIAGAKTMVGTSGGGFDLMTETLSLCGIAQIPLVFYLCQRPGPATGLATYTAQGDLNLALYSGHGEFNRIVLAPGNPLEAEELTNQAFYLSQKFQTPSIILSDKHLAESFYTLKEKAKLVKVPSNTKLKRYNSYEQDSTGSATENSEIIKKNIELRKKIFEQIKKESSKFSTYSIYGNKNSKNTIVSWGSTKGAIIDAISNLDVKFVQVKYLNPFPKSISKELQGNLILIENNSSAQLGELIKKEIGIEIKTKILRYDGRPFLADELNKELLRRIK